MSRAGAATPLEWHAASPSNAGGEAALFFPRRWSRREVPDPPDAASERRAERGGHSWDWRAPLRQAEQERQSLSPEQRARAGRQCTFVIVSAALLLTWQHYGSGYLVRAALAEPVRAAAKSAEAQTVWRGLSEDRELRRLLLWAGNTTAAYLFAPLLLTGLVLRRSPAEFGCKFAGAHRGLPLYGLMLLVMLPLILLLSGSAGFRHTYPFYRSLELPDPASLLAWELAYALQFVAVEYFFRGYLLHGTREALGPYAVLTSVIPYCMIHFGKPLPETLGAIAAGLVLGYMSLWLRSIWLGAALHIGVAWSMDAAVLLRRYTEHAG